MEYVTLGRTGLRTSVLGLGGGGHSRLGQQRGADDTQSIAVVRRAFELGVSFFDTAESYRTEAIIGEGLRGVPRDGIVVSTKKSLTEGDQHIDAAGLARGLEASLQRLQMDYVDIYHLHGVRADQYDYAVAELVPALIKLREQGKIRYLGITEAFGSETSHAMMMRAVQDEYWDVVMVGFNILNQSARERIFIETQRRNIGVLCMFAVREALSKSEKLRQTITELVQQRQLDPDTVDLDDPLGFVTASDGIRSLPDAAYRFCRAEPGIDVVLSGTGSIGHLEENVHSILALPLPTPVHERLVTMFSGIDSVSGQ